MSSADHVRPGDWVGAFVSCWCAASTFDIVHDAGAYHPGMDAESRIVREVMDLRNELAVQRTTLRRQQFAMMGLVACLAGSVLLGAVQSPPAAPAGATPPATVPLVPQDVTFGVVTCREVRVVDASGQPRVRLGSAANGTVGIDWLASDGRRRLSAEVAADGSPSVGLSDSKGASRLVASVGAQGDASIQWFDAERRMRINAASQANGMAGLYWWDTNDRQRMPRITAETGKNGNVVFPTTTGR